ncbi:MAG: serine hydrolase domain-containing protein [Bacteroidia bacterium]|nr:serine hydrolase domain-containing protein [Bacteroidia bacterium]
MKKHYCLILCLMILSCEPTDMIQTLTKRQHNSRELSLQIQKILEKAEVAGLSVQIFNNHQRVYEQAFGFADLEKGDRLTNQHGFYGASFSKAVFGYIVADLVVNGVLDLDKPLQSYVGQAFPDIPFEKDWKGYANLKGDLRYEKITARMCMNHSTGFPNWRWISKEGEFDREGKIQLLFDPGSRYSYSGEGIHLLQFVIEKITGKGLEEIAQEKVFNPLNMSMSSYLWQERFEGKFCLGHKSDGSTYPKDKEDEAGAAGSMETTPEDYAKFFEHILQLYKADDTRVELMFTPSIKIHSEKQFGPQSWIDSGRHDNIELGYGIGWGLLQSPHGIGAFKEGHSDGFQHYSIMFPEKGIGIILMSNSDRGESTFKELLELTIGDTYTPWEWEFYIPYDQE